MSADGDERSSRPSSEKDDPISVRLSRMEKALEDWEQKNGLPPLRRLRSESEALQYLDLPAADRRRLTPEECSEAAVVLSSYALYVNRLCQIEQARAQWLEQVLDTEMASAMTQRRAGSREERRGLTLGSDPVWQRLEQLRREALARCNRLGYFAHRIEYIAGAFQNLGHARKRERAHGG